MVKDGAAQRGVQCGRIRGGGGLDRELGGEVEKRI